MAASVSRRTAEHLLQCCNRLEVATAGRTARGIALQSRLSAPRPAQQQPQQQEGLLALFPQQRQQRRCMASLRRAFSSTSTGTEGQPSPPPPDAENQAEPSVAPSAAQLRKHFVNQAVPMVGFGFMDNTVMLHAGNAIDLTFGVYFGLSTLAAAACGQICSDVAGVSFGGLIEAAAGRLGLPQAHLTEEQRDLRIVKNIGLLGGVVGVCTGCSLGLLNLFFIDTNVARQLKLAHQGEGGNDVFAIDVSNEEREHATAITIEGPDIDGVIASVTTAMAVFGCKIQEMSGARGKLERMAGGITSREGHGMCFTFWVEKDGEQVDDDQIEVLAKAILAAAKEPGNVRHLSQANEALRDENTELKHRVERMEARLDQHMLTVTRRKTTPRLISELDNVDAKELRRAMPAPTPDSLPTTASPSSEAEANGE